MFCSHPAVRRRRGSRLSLPCILTTGWADNPKQEREKVLFETTPEFVRLNTQTWRRDVTCKNNGTYILDAVGQRFEPLSLKWFLLTELLQEVDIISLIVKISVVHYLYQILWYYFSKDRKNLYTQQKHFCFGRGACTLVCLISWIIWSLKAHLLIYLLCKWSNIYW